MGGREEIIRDGYGNTTVVEERNTGFLGMYIFYIYI
jgi:hypothetical protein